MMFTGCFAEKNPGSNSLRSVGCCSVCTGFQYVTSLKHVYFHGISGKVELYTGV